MKLGIIGGAGLLGSTTAFFTGSKNVLDEIKLLDLKENIAMSHVMDMGQALQIMSKTKISAATYEDLGDCDIILNTASLPERAVQNRNEYLQGNLEVITPICNELKKHCKNSIIITGTNPVDVFNYVIWKKLGWDSNRVIGFSANDTLRMKWSVSKVTGKEYSKIQGYCVGEHGDGQVPLFYQLKYEGKDLNLSHEKIQEANTSIANWFREYQALDSGRTSGWTSAVTLTEIITAIATDSKKVIPCSTIYGDEGYSIGTPVALGINGIEEKFMPELTAEQNQKFKESSEKIKGLINSIGY